MPTIIDRAREDILQSPQMRMKFVTQDKLFEQTDQIDNKFADSDSQRNQIMYDLATVKNNLVEYTHKKDFY